MSAATRIRITDVETIPISLPLRREWRWRGLRGSLGRWVILRLHTDEGLVGLGEATPLPDWGGDFSRYAGETPGTVVHVVRDVLGPVVSGMSPFDVELIVERMDGAIRGHLYAKAAIEMALYDLQGKAAGLPAYDLLGGRYRSGVRVAHMIGLMDREEAVEEALAALEDGCTAFQIKASGDPGRDASVTHAVRDAVGPDALLRVDANQGYRRLGVKDAIRAVRNLEDAGADCVEQPTEGLPGMAAVTEAVDATIIADESAWQPQDVVELANNGAADAISVYVAKAGGLLRAKGVATVAGVFGLPCDVNGSLESGVGNAANVHLATACPAISLPSVIPVTSPAGGPHRTAGRYYADDVVTEPFVYRDGFLHAPGGPGLGIELDEEKLEAYRTG
ncbi:Muconate cycloisomerase [Rubrobacter xylanophilus DSM 9941]|uniref:Muconate cycloisomerase n=1 Tax=Rubrobacter xylanophilus (strain DSM 9941 / JCM 11954 / NBRC 16129 / PRD-1) TaxID=266117 RepID=Q1ARM6_RUBXD|nr:enolase C-terminal domain-like protein [Rubrobacter xylanophilus]ABG05952.1 Muconate cycloisomerase [Rubrobacter xylanophilus DSM 9941]